MSFWTNMRFTRSRPQIEMRMFEGKVYQCQSLRPKNIYAMELVPYGQVNTGVGISIPRKQWFKLPLADHPE